MVPVSERRSDTALIIDVKEPLARNPGSLREVVVPWSAAKRSSSSFFTGTRSVKVTRN